MSDLKKQKVEDDRQIIIQFVDPDGNQVGSEIDIPMITTIKQMADLLNATLENDEVMPYAFHVGSDEHGVDLATSLAESWAKLPKAERSSERTLMVKFYPLSTFRVRPVTRCTSSMEGHTEAVLCVAFSPDSQSLATGSGDCTVRLWDLNTELPKKELKGHKHWVLSLGWSPDGSRLASAGMDNNIITWQAKDGKLMNTLKGHKKPITCVCWQPLHCATGFPWLASASKDNAIRVWDVLSGVCRIILTSHTAPVMCIRWSGEDMEEGGLIYSGARDRMIKVWNPTSGRMCKELKGHAHWVNTLALNTDYVIRSGPFDHTKPSFKTIEEAKAAALARYKETVEKAGGERLLTGSDDFTIFLWNPSEERKPITRMTGHQKIVNHVVFSPDGRFVASASFDKSTRIWDGRTGKYLNTLRGHVGSVYMCAWSADSRMLVTASKDSTMKVWDVSKGKLKEDLPGHADEVYALDWSVDGARVASGSKDRIVKIWRH